MPGGDEEGGGRGGEDVAMVDVLDVGRDEVMVGGVRYEPVIFGDGDGDGGHSACTCTWYRRSEMSGMKVLYTWRICSYG